MQTRSKLERANDAALRAAGGVVSMSWHRVGRQVEHQSGRQVGRSATRHAMRLSLFLLIGLFACTAPWWWQRMAALPLATAALWLTRSPPARRSLIEFLELVPYLDPVRGSQRTRQLVYQFVRPSVGIGDDMTTTLEQLIASFLQIGLAKVDGKLSTPTQQLLANAVPTIVSAIASVVVDLAENHTAIKAAAAKPA